MSHLLAACLIALLPTLLSAAELDARLAALARPAPAATRYVEVRWSRLLTTPVMTSGTLEYPGPGLLEKHTLAPYREDVTIDGDRITIARHGEPLRRLSMARAPELRGLLGSFGALLSGDREALERDFTLDFEERAGDWLLRLAPRDARTRKRIAVIDVYVRADEPRCIVVSEADGDASALLFNAAPDSIAPRIDRASVESRCGQPP